MTFLRPHGLSQPVCNCVSAVRCQSQRKSCHSFAQSTPFSASHSAKIKAVRCHRGLTRWAFSLFLLFSSLAILSSAQTWLPYSFSVAIINTQGWVIYREKRLIWLIVLPHEHSADISPALTRYSWSHHKMKSSMLDGYMQKANHRDWLHFNNSLSGLTQSLRPALIPSQECSG